MKGKTISFIFLILLIAISITACSPDNTSEEPNNEATSLLNVTIKSITIAENYISVTWCDPSESSPDNILVKCNNTAYDIDLSIETCTITGLNSNEVYKIEITAVYSNGSSETINFNFTTNETGIGAIEYNIIRDADDLNNVRNNLDKNYFVISDIDLIDFQSGEGWEPIGLNTTNPFTGILNGNNYKIKNLFINRSGTTGIGLFGYLDNSQIINVRIEDCNISGTNAIGSIAGRVENNSLIKNCSSSGKITGYQYIGGIAGLISDTSKVDHSFTSADIEGKNVLGGFAGYNYGKITYSYSSGNVTLDDSFLADDFYNNAGGFVGINEGIIQYSSASSTVKAEDSDYIGGLIGSCIEGSVSYCYASGIVLGDLEVGGFIGYAYASSITSCYSDSLVTANNGRAGGFIGYNNETGISNCYTLGEVEGAWSVGGFIGQIKNSTVTNCYSRSKVISAETTNIGGFIGANININTISASYWNTETSNQTTSNGGTGLTTDQMQNKSSYSTNWDFVNTWSISVSENFGYPYLQDMP